MTVTIHLLYKYNYTKYFSKYFIHYVTLTFSNTSFTELQIFKKKKNPWSVLKEYDKKRPNRNPNTDTV